MAGKKPRTTSSTLRSLFCTALLLGVPKAFAEDGFPVDSTSIYVVPAGHYFGMGALAGLEMAHRAAPATLRPGDLKTRYTGGFALPAMRWLSVLS